MNKILFLILLTACGAAAVAQPTVPGYYIANNGDSIATQIKIPRSIFAEDLGKLLMKVEVVDAAGKTEKFKPKESQRFGLLYKEQQLDFFSKPTGTPKNFRFLQALVLGPKKLW